MDFGWHWKTLPVLLTVAEQFQPNKKGFGATKCKTFEKVVASRGAIRTAELPSR